jgi:hypothetical protein
MEDVPRSWCWPGKSVERQKPPQAERVTCCPQRDTSPTGRTRYQVQSPPRSPKNPCVHLQEVHSYQWL